MKRLTMWLVGLFLAYGTAWLGNQAVAAFPQNIASLPDLWQKIYASGATVTLAIATVSSALTLVLILFYAARYLRQKENIWTGNGLAFTTAVTLVGASYAFGAYAQPFDFGGPNPLNWIGLGKQWNFAAVAILLPSAMLLRLFVLEAWARVRGKKDPLQIETDRLGGQVNLLGEMVDKFEDLATIPRRIESLDVDVHDLIDQIATLPALHAEVQLLLTALGHEVVDGKWKPPGITLNRKVIRLLEATGFEYQKDNGDWKQIGESVVTCVDKIASRLDQILKPHAAPAEPSKPATAA